MSYPSKRILLIIQAGLDATAVVILLILVLTSPRLRNSARPAIKTDKSRKPGSTATSVRAFYGVALLLVSLGLWQALSAYTHASGVDVAAGLATLATWAFLSFLTYVYPPAPVRSYRGSEMKPSMLQRGLDVVRKLVGVTSVPTAALVPVVASERQWGLLVFFLVEALALGGQWILSWRISGMLTAGANAACDISALQHEPLLSVVECSAHESVETESMADKINLDEPEQLESDASILSRLAFWWITPLLSRGYRNKRLDAEDLPALEPGDRPATTHAALRREWARRAEIARQRGRSLKPQGGWLVMRVLLAAQWRTFVVCGAVLTLATALQLSVPVVLNRLLAHIEAGLLAKGGAGKGYALAVLLFALAVLQSVSEHQFWIWGVRCGMRAQSALMGECFRKALWLGPESRRKYSSGQLINLMSVDACRVADVNVVPMVHWGTWCAVLTLTISLVALHALLGASSFVGVIIIVVFWPLGYLLGLRGKKAAMHIQRERDNRASVMAEVLESIRLVKSLQWEDFANSIIKQARQREVKAQIQRSACFGGNNALAQLAQVMGPLASFACRILWEKEPLTAAVAFTSLAWFNLLKRPLNCFPSALTSFMDCLVSWARLEELFLSEEVSALQPPEDAAPHNALENSSSAPSVALSPLSPSVPESCVRRALAVEMSECSFAWTREGNESPPTLQDVTLRVKAGEFVVVVGPVGAGKSTLLHSLVGDTIQVKDVPGVRWAVHGKVALVEQTPWIQNTTIRDNVVFGAALGYKQDRFREVIRRCGLLQDLQGLAVQGGEMMEVGESGIALSGGQRQRISLARALYSDPDICLFDDVLSSLDVSVGRRIWDECLVDFLRGKTRVVVTHQTHFIHHPAVDRIVVLDACGRLRASGVYNELVASEDQQVVDAVLAHDNSDGRRTGVGPRRDVPLGSSHALHLVGEEEEGRHETLEGGLGAKSHFSFAERRIEGGLAGSTDGGECAGEIEVDSEKGAWGPEEYTGMKVQAFNDWEERRQGGIEPRLLVMYLRRFGGFDSLTFVGFVLGLLITEQACNVLQWFWLSHLTGAESGAESASIQAAEVTALIGLGAALCVITTVRILVLIFGAVTAGNVLHGAMLRAILRAPMRFFDRQPSGRILNRFIADQAAIDGIVPSTLADFFQQLLYFGATLAILCYALPEMLPVVVLLAMPYRAISQYYRWPARDLRRLEAVSKSPVNTQYGETVRGASTIRAFGAQERFFHAHLALSTRSIQSYWIKWVANQWVTIWLEMVGTLFMLFCGVLAVWVTGPQAPEVLASHIDGGKMGLLMSYAVLVPNNLGWLLKVYFMAEIEFISVERVFQYVRLKPETSLVGKASDCGQVNAENGTSEGESSHVSAQKEPAALPLPTAAGVEGHEIYLCYGERGSSPTLRGFCLGVRAGEKVAIVGRTGAGKSSIFQALLGFYHVESSKSFAVEKVEVSRFSLKSLRHWVRLIPQHPTLFGTTLMDALVGREAMEGKEMQAREAEVWQALEAVRMAQSVRALPRGLDTRLRTLEFSEGERQLLCIARALLHLAPVMLCDEVTSAIDLKTDAIIHKIILSLPCTVLWICHRLQHIQDFDRVLVMERGRCVEEGPPAVLLGDVRSTLSGMVSECELGLTPRVFREEEWTSDP